MMPEPGDMRVLVIGTSGAGKTMFASALATALELQHTELDQLHWGPDWKPAPTDQFVRAAAQAAAGQRWVMDGNYSVVREQLWPRATHIVWLNYGRWTVFSRVLWRTTRRAALDTQLFHGNRESWRSAFFQGTPSCCGHGRPLPGIGANIAICAPAASLRRRSGWSSARRSRPGNGWSRCGGRGRAD